MKGTKNYQINCNTNPLWNGVIDTIRFDPTSDQGVNLCIKNFAITAPSSAWVFDKGNLLNGWNANKELKNLQYTDNGIDFISGKDCLLISPICDFPNGKFKAIEVVMKSDKADNGQIFFSNKKNGFTEINSRQFRIDPSAELKTYKIELPDSEILKEGTLQLRFDPVRLSGVKVKLQSIKLVKN